MSVDTELELRRLLWLRHGCRPDTSALYGDDGEMQCHACGVDFRRMTPDQIDIALTPEPYRTQRLAMRTTTQAMPARVDVKIRIEAFKNVVVSDATMADRRTVDKALRKAKIPLLSSPISPDGSKIVVYCKTPEEAGRLKMVLQAELDPL